MLVSWMLQTAVAQLVLPAVSGEQELGGNISGMAGIAVSGVYEVVVTSVKL